MNDVGPPPMSATADCQHVSAKEVNCHITHTSLVSEWPNKSEALEGRRQQVLVEDSNHSDLQPHVKLEDELFEDLREYDSLETAR